MNTTLSRASGLRHPAVVARLLHLFAGCFVFCGAATIALARPGDPGPWLRFAVWALCSGLGYAILERALPGRDPVIFAIAMLLSGWGLVAIDRLAPNFAARQTLWLGLSMAALLYTACAPQVLGWLRRFRYVLLALALLLLLATMALGSNPSGLAGAPRLWLGVGSVYFQPSEAMKLILVAFLASYLGEESASVRVLRLPSARPSPRLLGPILVMWQLCLVILVWQRDLGAAMLIFVVFILLLYVTSGDWRIIAGGALLVIIAGAAASELFDVVRLRVDIWLDPWSEAAGRAYQIVQSLMAFAAGGVFGAGLGGGFPNYVPVAHSDFVFAAIAEEAGFLGVVAVLGCFAVLAWRGFAIALRPDTRAFNQLFAVGMTLMIVVQALMIMAGVLKLLPLTGVTLPFISYGGSSLLVCFTMTGLLLRLSAGVR